MGPLWNRPVRLQAGFPAKEWCYSIPRAHLSIFYKRLGLPLGHEDEYAEAR
jgi:hypothetical protein